MSSDLEARLRVMLPAFYPDEPLEPVKMRSAGLQYGPDGRVAWDSIWRSFCDLAMAGGPPHRGTFLAPGGPAPAEVTAELCRGLHLVTGLYAEPAADGVRMYCTSAGMAGWLTRAIVMENVWARAAGLSLYLPAGPAFRVEKEIRNVITATAKTCHSWLEHTPVEQQYAISCLLRAMDGESPLVYPQAAGLEHRRRVAARVNGATVESASWIGIVCADTAEAVRRMRRLAVCNVLARREGSQILLPVNEQSDPGGDLLARAVAQA